MIEIFDRVVEFPGRFRLRAVPGEDGVFDLVPIPGEVAEAGTPINRTLFHQVQYDSAMASLMAFVTNANADALDVAFGKGRLPRETYGIGLALAMYAWYRGVDRTEHPFEKLSRQETISDCCRNAMAEILGCQEAQDLIVSSPYAKENMVAADNVRAWKKDYGTMNAIVQHANIVDAIRELAWESMKEGWQVYTERGEFEFVVPSGVSCLTVEVVGAGANGPYSAGGAGGGYELAVLSVVPGQRIAGNIVAPGGNTTFGTISIPTGAGAPGGKDYGQAGSTPSQGGKFLRVGSGGSAGNNTRGGGGGYGGGSGGRGGASTYGAVANGGAGGVGPNVLPESSSSGGVGGAGSSGKFDYGAGEAGTNGGGGGSAGWCSSQSRGTGGGGGAGYGGGGGGGRDYDGGAGGSGCVVIYM